MSSDFPARLVVSITPEDVGRRVSLRRRLHTGGYSDVVGVLESWSGGTLKIRRRGGELVEVAEETLAAGKVVPPPPAKVNRPAKADPAVRASREPPPEDRR
ncbi:MAG TPA: hypothetical protein VE465_19685 [Streptosporangiaceae bacterium]|jgi:hypothetical protein|nr:hypothetical protein [Streptosporangiaceae bacterium]